MNASVHNFKPPRKVRKSTVRSSTSRLSPKMRMGLWILGLVLFVFVGWIGGSYGLQYWIRQKVSEELQRYAEKYQWQLGIYAMEWDWKGHFKFKNIHGKREGAGSITIDEFEIEMPPSQWFKDRPYLSKWSIKGVRGALTYAEGHRLWRIFRNLKPVSSKNRSYKPPLIIEQLSLTFRALPILDEIHIEAAKSKIDFKKTLHEMDLQLSIGESWSSSGKIYINMGLERGYQSVQLDLSWPYAIDLPHYGRFKIKSLGIDRFKDEIYLHFYDIDWLPDKRWGIESLSMQEFQVALNKSDERDSLLGHWKLKSIWLESPQIEIDVLSLIRGPIQEFYPKLSMHLEEIAKALQRDKGLPWIEISNLPEPEEQSHTAPELLTTRSSLSKLYDKIHPLKWTIHQASIGFNLSIYERFSLNGLNLKSTQGDQYPFKFSIQQTEVNIQVSKALLRGEVTPSHPFAFKVTEIEVGKLFDLLGIPRLKSLKGWVNFDFQYYRDERNRHHMICKAELLNGQFYHPKVSESVVKDIWIKVEFHGLYDEMKDHLEAHEIVIKSGPITINIDLDVERVQDDPKVSFRIWGKDLKCEDLPKAIPKGLLESINRLQIEGEGMSPEFKGSMLLSDPLTLTLKVKGLPGDCHVTEVLPYDVEQLNRPDYVHKMTYSTIKGGVPVGPGTSWYTPLSELPEYIPAAMYLTEDVLFYTHQGLRIGQFRRALQLNLKYGRYVYGGSSLTQQLVKNLFLHRRKTLSRKLEEAILAWHLEEHVSKNRILELYINAIEFGPDIYGITRAAKFYFDKKVKELTPLEAAYLASLKPSPSHGGRFYRYGFPKRKRWWNKRQEEILERLCRAGYISPIEVLAAYPWIPKFSYPSPDAKGDMRNQWLKKHNKKP